MPVVTLRTCRTLEDADLIVAQLEQAGIKAMIPDEALMQTVAWNANAYGYVRVQVAPGQFDDAVLFLKEWETNQEADTDEEAVIRQARAKIPLPVAMKCLIVLLPATCAFGLLIAGMIRTRYLKRGFQACADAVWAHFAAGFCLWFIFWIVFVALSSH